MRRPKKVLLLGAGGMGMAPLALYLRGAGVRVEAFDDRFSEPIRSHLLSFGVKIIDELTQSKFPIVLSIRLQFQKMILVLPSSRRWVSLFIEGVISLPNYLLENESLRWLEVMGNPV